MNTTLNIIYEDNEIIALYKPAGLATQTRKLGEKDLFSQVKNYLKGRYVGIINRLDQPVEGIVLMAKDSKSAANLEYQIQNGKTEKYYHATVYLDEDIKEAMLVNITPYSSTNELSLSSVKDSKPLLLTDYCKKNSSSNQSEICPAEDPDAREARLEYNIIDINQNTATLDIHLLTGRHHQIRLQLSNAGMPILGDSKYGSTASKIYSRENRIKNVKLCAYKYAFTHPKTHERVELTLHDNEFT